MKRHIDSQWYVIMTYIDRGLFEALPGIFFIPIKRLIISPPSNKDAFFLLAVTSTCFTSACTALLTYKGKVKMGVTQLITTSFEPAANNFHQYRCFQNTRERDCSDLCHLLSPLSRSFRFNSNND